jgi:hypothetical protein
MLSPQLLYRHEKINTHQCLTILEEDEGQK